MAEVVDESESDDEGEGEAERARLVRVRPRVGARDPDAPRSEVMDEAPSFLEAFVMLGSLWSVGYARVRMECEGRVEKLRREEVVSCENNKKKLMLFGLCIRCIV